jgi:hypothetical protein
VTTIFYDRDQRKAVWLPNGTVAKAWLEYITTGAVGDTTPPPAPYDVKVTAQGDQGLAIEWNADADFESGLPCFMVLRDAHVPKGGMIVDGMSLLGFNSFPMRIKEVPDEPYQAVLEEGHLDATFKRSKCTRR